LYRRRQHEQSQTENKGGKSGSAFSASRPGSVIGLKAVRRFRSKE
jgi:hypothetical protein